ncbi:hypothetical protein FSP39_000725 [Pinctada imbricata]|uniref:Uncharacterized protein n=1 Tax=Pinctada imbricata TaxID=66713 RepID=A0AA88XPV9_PINIB|nr:hypothetical protein FSP39_000725 [Pinctada imbricata]
MEFASINRKYCLGGKEYTESALFEYTPDGNQRIQIISKDSSGKILFSTPTIVQQNKNKDYIVCETTKIVAVSSDGNLRWEYSDYTTRMEDFRPFAFCCDNFSNVIVADFDNGIIDILSREGKFVSTILTQRDGIVKPYALSVDEDDYLWIGSSLKKEIMIFRYLG